MIDLDQSRFTVWVCERLIFLWSTIYEGLLVQDVVGEMDILVVIDSWITLASNLIILCLSFFINYELY